MPSTPPILGAGLLLVAILGSSNGVPGMTYVALVGVTMQRRAQ